jgi:hypothetical protein
VYESFFNAWRAPPPPDISWPIIANVLDSVGNVTNVAFYASGSGLGAVGGAPFTMAWHNPPPGNYALQALATDDVGLNTTSAAVYITVQSGSSGTIDTGGDAPLLSVRAQCVLMLGLALVLALSA